MYGDVSSIRQVHLGQDISARSGGETGEQRRPILRLVLAGLALVHDLVLIVVHDRSLVLLLIQLQLLVSIPSPQPKLSLILIYRNHWQNANRVSAHSESSHNPYTHACKRSHAALPVALFTPLSFRRSLPTVNAVRQLIPCWFASQARPSYLSARWILPTIPARDAPFLLIAHCPPTLCSHMPRSFTPLPSPGFFGLPHIFAAPQDPHTCLHSRHSPSCVLKCAPKRQVREHKDANAPVCVPMCARSSFRRAHSDANGRRIVESGCAGAADGRCASVEHDCDESRGASGAYHPLGLPHNAFFDGFWAGVVRGHRRSRFGPLKNGGFAVHVVPHHVM